MTTLTTTTDPSMERIAHLSVISSKLPMLSADTLQWVNYFSTQDTLVYLAQRLTRSGFTLNYARHIKQRLGAAIDELHPALVAGALLNIEGLRFSAPTESFVTPVPCSEHELRQRQRAMLVGRDASHYDEPYLVAHIPSHLSEWVRTGECALMPRQPGTWL